MQFQGMHNNMDFQIHQLEQEAYTSVLRAFRAQSDAITWEKEGLIAKLRIELRMSDDEHREILTVVKDDDTVCKIRLGKAATNPLVGRKVMMREPEDNTFYEAVIREYNPVEGRHALVYDINTPKETWKWVNLQEISPEDIRWVGEDPRIARQRVRKEQDAIEILDTETLINEVKKVFATSHPDINKIMKAKKMLKDHEQTLINVIEKLADESDFESDGDHQISQEQLMIREI